MPDHRDTARPLVGRSPVLLSIAVALALAAPTFAQSPDALAEAGHWKRVRAIVEPLVKSNPNDAHATWLLARVKEAFGDREAALPLAEKAVALDPRNASYHVRLSSIAGALAQNASIFRKMSLGKRCKSELEAALAANPNDAGALRGMMEFLWQAPGFFGGDKKKAREMAARLVQVDPVAGYIAQAQIAWWEKQPGKVEELYQKAADVDPRSYVAQVTLAGYSVSQATPRFDVAEKHGREAVSIAPDRVSAYSTLARVYAHQQRVAELETLLRDAEHQIPDNLSPYLTAANTLLSDGKDLPRAESYIRKYLTQEREGFATSHGVACWRLALVLEKQGRRQDAIAEAEKAAQLEPAREDIGKDLKRLKAGKTD